MGAGQGKARRAQAAATTRSTAADKVVASVNDDESSPAPEEVRLCRSGGVSVYADNEFGVQTDEFALLAGLEKLLADTGQDTVTAHELAQRVSDAAYTSISTQALSTQLRRLVDKGHVKQSRNGKALSFSLARDLDEFFKWRTVSIAGAGGRGSTVNLHATRLYVGDKDGFRMGADEWDERAEAYLVGTDDFVRGAAWIAKQTLEGKENGFELIEASDTPSGKATCLAMFPYRFKKGRRQKPMVGFKHVTLGGAANVHWDGRPYESDFMDGIVTAEDLRTAAALIGNRRATELGVAS